ncbi:hypothetical protein DL93DRAFT_2173365 [Clavulina sp. PMI_390]|nr:hypothetical protein DL93DRAFT_2173365 [Clavulina sp. PMI_390]
MPALAMISTTTFFCHIPSGELVDPLPSVLHFKYYLEKAHSLIQSQGVEGMISLSRSQFIRMWMRNLRLLLDNTDIHPRVERIVISLWFSDSTAKVSSISSSFPEDTVPQNITKHRGTITRHWPPGTSPSTASSYWKWSGEMELEECAPRWGLDAATWDRLCGFGDLSASALPSLPIAKTALQLGNVAESDSYFDSIMNRNP